MAIAEKHITVESGRLIKRLAAFGKGVLGKKLRSALRAGAKPILARVKQLAPVLAKQKKSGRRTLNPRPRRSPMPVRGLLKKSFGVRAMKRKKDRTGVIIITGKLHKAAFYGWFVERGTHSLAPGIRRKHRKGFAAKHGQTRIKPRMYIHRGFEQTKMRARIIILHKLRQGVREAVAEARRVA